jgi:hypothetical protein
MVNQIPRNHTVRIQDAVYWHGRVIPSFRADDRCPLARPVAGNPRRVLKP